MIKIVMMRNKLLLIGFCLINIHIQAQIIYGVSNYTQYHLGSLPIIISVPHGGSVAPTNIPDRTCGSPTMVTDSYTIELSRQLDTALFILTGCHPHLIICNLKRTKIDCNRNKDDGACGNIDAEKAWDEFHQFIDTAQYISQKENAGKALYIDLHGHGKPILRLELGYGITSTALNKTDSFLNTAAQIESSSIEKLVKTNVNGYTHAALLRGKYAMGTMLANAGFPSVPSQQTPDPDTTAYFNGGYNTFNHTCIREGNTINGFQLECHSTVRANYINRKIFADSLANTIARFLSIHQNIDLKNNCGLLTMADEHHYNPDYSMVLFPNPANDEIQINIDHIEGNYRIIITNTYGKMVLNQHNHNKINLNHWPNGLYVVHVTDEYQHIWRNTFVKQ